MLARATILTLLLSAGPALAQTVTPRRCDATAVTTGGSPVNAVSGPVTSGWLQNPLSATDQGVDPAEPLYLDEVGAAGTVGNGTTRALAPGEVYQFPLNSSATVSVTAATAGHKFACERW
jgi:hypothetical protein